MTLRVCYHSLTSFTISLTELIRIKICISWPTKNLRGGGRIIAPPPVGVRVNEIDICLAIVLNVCLLWLSYLNHFFTLISISHSLHVFWRGVKNVSHLLQLLLSDVAADIIQCPSAATLLRPALHPNVEPALNFDVEFYHWIQVTRHVRTWKTQSSDAGPCGISTYTQIHCQYFALLNVDWVWKAIIF